MSKDLFNKFRRGSVALSELICGTGKPAEKTYHVTDTGSLKVDPNKLVMTSEARRQIKAVKELAERYRIITHEAESKTKVGALWGGKANNGPCDY